MPHSPTTRRNVSNPGDFNTAMQIATWSNSGCGEAATAMQECTTGSKTRVLGNIGLTPLRSKLVEVIAHVDPDGPGLVYRVAREGRRLHPNLR